MTILDTAPQPVAAPGANMQPQHVRIVPLSTDSWVNSVAISNNGSRIAGASFFHCYDRPVSPNMVGRFGTYCYDSRGEQPGRLLAEEYDGSDGVFAVALSGDGETVAAGGWRDKTAGLLRAYPATGGAALLDYQGIQSRISCVALSDQGEVLAAAADKIYIFRRDGNSYATPPVIWAPAGDSRRFTAVAVHPGGEWIAACDKVGQVYAGPAGSAEPSLWKAPEPLPFLCVAIARTSSFFAVGGGDFVYQFDYAAITGGRKPVGYDTRDDNTPAGKPGAPAQNVRWVAISGDGDLVTAVANRGLTDDTKSGLLIAVARDDGRLVERWNRELAHNPNSTSIDERGRYVTACDGYPVGRPAKFYLFDAAGNPLWEYDTRNMNWPMVISPDGTGIAAGGDDGNLYYFRP